MASEANYEVLPQLERHANELREKIAAMQAELDGVEDAIIVEQCKTMSIDDAEPTWWLHPR